MKENNEFIFNLQIIYPAYHFKASVMFINRIIYTVCGISFFTIQNFNDIKELQNILVLLMIGYPIGIIFKTLFFQLSHERDIKKLRSMSYEELLSALSQKFF